MATKRRDQTGGLIESCTRLKSPPPRGYATGRTEGGGGGAGGGSKKFWSSKTQKTYTKALYLLQSKKFLEGAVGVWQQAYLPHPSCAAVCAYCLASLFVWRTLPPAVHLLHTCFLKTFYPIFQPPGWQRRLKGYPKHVKCVDCAKCGGLVKPQTGGTAGCYLMRCTNKTCRKWYGTVQGFSSASLSKELKRQAISRQNKVMGHCT